MHAPRQRRTRCSLWGALGTVTVLRESLETFVGVAYFEEGLGESANSPKYACQFHSHDTFLLSVPSAKLAHQELRAQRAQWLQKVGSLAVQRWTRSDAWP
jgi:Na+-transporting NADH:ubiquinone oxidoreductase subunit NqrC